MPNPVPPHCILLLCGDLFFATQLRSAAEQAGFELQMELGPGKLQERVASETYAAVILDLETRGLDVANVMSALPAEGRPTVVAFGPHVQIPRLEAARAAGCDHVLSRGQIAASLGALLERL